MTKDFQYILRYYLSNLRRHIKKIIKCLCRLTATSPSDEYAKYFLTAFTKLHNNIISMLHVYNGLI